MSKTFAAAAVALAALIAPAAALAFNAPPAQYRVGPGPHGPVMAAPPPMAAAPLLPDFPAEARPGECWARTPIGPGGRMGAPPAGQPVWTLKRGHGPEAVWRFDRRPVDGAMARGFDGPYEWVRVTCSGEEAYAEAPPAPPASHAPPPPPPPVVHAPPAPHAPMPHGMTHPGPKQHGAMAHGAMHQREMREMHERHMQQGGMQHGPMMRERFVIPRPPHGMAPHGPMTPPMGPPPGAFAGAPIPPMPMEPVYAPPPSPPRWFGDRFLTWGGKTAW